MSDWFPPAPIAVYDPPVNGWLPQDVLNNKDVEEQKKNVWRKEKALYNLTCVIKGFVILQAAAVSIFTNVHKFGLPLYKKYK